MTELAAKDCTVVLRPSPPSHVRAPPRLPPGRAVVYGGSLRSCEYVFMLRSVVRDTLQTVVGLASTHRAHPHGEPGPLCAEDKPRAGTQAYARYDAVGKNAFSVRGFRLL